MAEQSFGEGDAARRDQPEQTGSERPDATGSTTDQMKGNRKRAGEAGSVGVGSAEEESAQVTRRKQHLP